MRTVSQYGGRVVPYTSLLTSETCSLEGQESADGIQTLMSLSSPEVANSGR